MSDTPATNIINLSKERATRLAREDSVQESQGSGSAALITRSAAVRDATVSDLYSSEAEETKALSGRIDLLNSIEARLTSAIKLLDSDDPVGSDNEVTFAHSEMAEAFVDSDVESGFAALILAVFYALENRRGQALDRNQLSAVQSCISELAKNPYLDFIGTIPLINALNRSGLSTDPAIADELSEVLAN